MFSKTVVLAEREETVLNWRSALSRQETWATAKMPLVQIHASYDTFL